MKNKSLRRTVENQAHTIEMLLSKQNLEEAKEKALLEEEQKRSSAFEKLSEEFCKRIEILEKEVSDARQTLAERAHQMSSIKHTFEAEKLALQNRIDALELQDTKSQQTVYFSKMCIDYNDIERFDSCIIQDGTRPI